MAQKTPVSLMNELAKANKLNPEYKVIEESGPAHKRTFTVQLTLGDVGTWEGKATSIRSARHAAATAGLENCGLSKPEIEKPKIQQFSVTPTVELNVLAMKLGKLTQYHDLQPKIPSYQPSISMGYHGLQMQHHHHTGIHHISPRPRSPYSFPQPGQENHYRPYIQNGYHPRSVPPRVPRIFCVKLMVGDQEFYGEGRDKQKARQNAASKAIKVLQDEMVTTGEKSTTSTMAEEQKTINQNGKSNDDQPESSTTEDVTEVKSEISQVYEIASKRKLQVGFEDVKSSGPPHMKRFVVSATVGEFTTMGEGCKKKDAKQEAARKMLEELQKLPELPKEETSYQKSGRFVRRGPRISHQKTKGEVDPTLNPVSILGQILQRRRDQPPVYELLHEKANGHEREFTIQVTVGQHKVTGAGPNKKEAKKKASEAMLQLIGFRSPDGQSAVANSQGDKTVKTEKSETEQKVSLNSGGTSSGPPTILGRQLKPGLLPMVPELAKQTRSDMMNSVVAPIAQVKQEPQEPALQGGLNRAPGAPVVKTTPGKHLTTVQKLLHLAEVEGLRVQFTDYPKEREYLTLVTVSSIPPLMCYGSGATVEASREEAASNALKPLLQLGLDCTNKLKSFEESHATLQGSIKTQPTATNDVTTSDEAREHQPKED